MNEALARPGRSFLTLTSNRWNSISAWSLVLKSLPAAHLNKAMKKVTEIYIFDLYGLPIQLMPVEFNAW